MSVHRPRVTAMDVRGGRAVESQPDTNSLPDACVCTPRRGRVENLLTAAATSGSAKPVEHSRAGLVAHDRSTRLRAVCWVPPAVVLGLFLGFFLGLFPYPGPLAQLVELRTFNP